MPLDSTTVFPMHRVENEDREPDQRLLAALQAIGTVALQPPGAATHLSGGARVRFSRVWGIYSGPLALWLCNPQGQPRTCQVGHIGM